MGEPAPTPSAAPLLPVPLVVLPLVAILVLAASIFITGGEGEIHTALVLGGPTEGPTFRGRLQVLRERAGVAEAIPRHPVTLRAREGRRESVQRLTTDETGWVEFEVSRTGKEPLRLAVHDHEGSVLVEGAPHLERSRWASSARRRGGEARPYESGDFVARLFVVESVLSVPFEGHVGLRLENAGQPISGARVRLSAHGGTLTQSGEPLLATDERGQVIVGLTPTEHVVSLRARIESEEDEFEFEQTLPVVPGSFWLEEKTDHLVVHSPVPRDQVWYTFVTQDERLSGGRLDLEPSGAGTAKARIPRERIPSRKGLFVVLASDADGRSPSTVGFPLDGQGRTFDAWDAYLLDGSRAAREKLARKARKVRLTLGAYAAVAALLTLLLFVRYVRRSDVLLERRLRQAGVEDAAPERGALPLVIAVLSLFFAFSLGVLWIVAR